MSSDGKDKTEKEKLKSVREIVEGKIKESGAIDPTLERYGVEKGYVRDLLKKDSKHHRGQHFPKGRSLKP